jgi:LmbE family N-acetylglucosaminyl deacetylase
MNGTPVTRRDFISTSAAALAVLPLGALASTLAPAGRRPLNVVCVGAHPDDPESMCGGTLHKFSAAGHTVTVVYLTRGEAGIDGKGHAEAAAIRTGEAERACKILNVRPVFFGQIDGSTVFDVSAIEAMERTLAPLEPDVVFTHWPIDTHRDHQVASTLTIQARLRGTRMFEVYFCEAEIGVQSMGFRPTDYVDITKERAMKRESVFCHASQNPAEIYAEDGGRHDLMERFRGAECGAKAAEAFVRLSARGTVGLI